MSADDLPDLLTRAEAAAVLKVTPGAMGAIAYRKELPFVRTPGGHRRFHRDDVNRLAESRVTQVGGDAS